MPTVAERIVAAWNSLAPRYKPYAAIAIACALLAGRRSFSAATIPMKVSPSPSPAPRSRTASGLSRDDPERRRRQWRETPHPAARFGRQPRQAIERLTDRVQPGERDFQRTLLLGLSGNLINAVAQLEIGAAQRLFRRQQRYRRGAARRLFSDHNWSDADKRLTASAHNPSRRASAARRRRGGGRSRGASNADRCDKLSWAH